MRIVYLEGNALFLKVSNAILILINTAFNLTAFSSQSSPSTTAFLVAICRRVAFSKSAFSYINIAPVQLTLWGGVGPDALVIVSAISFRL